MPNSNPSPPPSINPSVRFAGNTILRLVRNAFLGVIGFNALVFLFIGGAFTASNYASIAYTAKSEAQITAVTFDTVEPSDTDRADTCSLAYTFTVNKKTYSGASTVSTPGNCVRPVGSNIAIKYDSQQPANSAVDDASSLYIGGSFVIVGLLLLIAFVVGIILSVRHAKREDRNNDGLANDGMPATSAQIKLIENGMRELGEFYTPRAMTQSEARETINEINKKLAK